MLSEDNQQDDYNYYAIDIANKQEMIDLVSFSRSLLETFILSACKEFLNMLITFIEFPPCDPKTFKLRQVCENDCLKFINISQYCFIDALQEGNMIYELITLNESVNCSDPATHFPIDLSKFFDSQQSCYTVSFFDKSKYS